MNCFDCAGLGITREAVAVCGDCGAGICADHAHVTPRWLTRTLVVNRVVAIEPPARSIRCGVCQAARESLEGSARAVRPAAADRPASRR